MFPDTSSKVKILIIPISASSDEVILEMTLFGEKLVLVGKEIKKE